MDLGEEHSNVSLENSKEEDAEEFFDAVEYAEDIKSPGQVMY